MSLSAELAVVPFLRNIGLLMSYRCQVACPHCIIEAGPNRHEEISLTNAFDWIQQIATYRKGHVKFLSLTGGEPFYNRESLKRIAAFGECHGLVTTAVTNAFWASTRDEALRLLGDLSVIKLLAISTDVYHQVSIPFEWVKNAILVAAKCGIPYIVQVCTENLNDTAYIETLKKLEEITEKDTIVTGITLPVGRALKRISAYKYEMTEDPPTSACPSAGSPIVFPDGKVIACIGSVINLPSSHPLVLGNLKENSLQVILDNAELNPILHAIRVWGPQELITMAKKAGLNHYLPQKYIKDSICDACYALMSSTKIVEFLNQLAEDFEFKRKVAYARVYYLNEMEMMNIMNL
jgi:organic radical activating enzyme